MPTYNWQRSYDQQVSLPGGKFAQWVGWFDSGTTLIRSLFGISAVAVVSSDVTYSTMARIVMGIGLVVHPDLNVTGAYTTPTPFTNSSYAGGPMERWLYWAAVPFTLVARDAQGIMAFELAGGDMVRTSEGQVLANTPPGDGVDVWVSMELSEPWDPNGTLIAAVWSEHLIRSN